MSLGDRRQENPAIDDVMTALYGQLDHHVSDSDAPYDVEAGLGQLMQCVDADRERDAPPEDAPAARAAADAAAIRFQMLNLARLESERSIRTTWLFGGILAFAMLAAGILVSVHLSTSVVNAIVAVTGLAAAAGVVIHRTSTAAALRYAEIAARPAREAEDYPGSQEGSGRQPGRIISRPPAVGMEPVRPMATVGRNGYFSRRLVTVLLAGLTLACLAGFVVIFIAMSASGLTGPYALGLLLPNGTSILFLITAWWWRAVDRRDRELAAAPSPGLMAGDTSVSGEEMSLELDR